MPRLKQAGREAGNPFANQIFDLLFEDRDPIAEPGTATGTPGNWWTVFNIVPDAFKHTTEGFQFYRSKNRKLDPKLRELGQIRAGFAVGSQFVFSQHCKASRDVGLTEDQIAAIPHWQVADCFSPLERAVLAYTDGLVLQRGRVPDGVFEALKAELSDEEILEFTYITCTYMMHAIMSRALKLEYDDVDERVVEIVAPDGSDTDVMSMVDKGGN
ncbi:MAG TPA: carboxymuconolactone decarboxylase [Hyphomonas sp.]|uniref:carboxymuconolactone decarboxylase family protein n=1 Tax=Hyphomonas sp. UBA3195 TaxID=1946622 RepID=UPI000C3AE5D3|nr:carboxymuconolactone decarboxylase family protein [Hyphomonas sp. UBA3195]MAA81388.1 carboxymuconolactone decarboxylase [Hyphomonas sp.]MAN92575.1 carboxymuconolactone decarboxylase [Hyphomonadaceae bacterium]MAX85036.1 carboxymuconolactone decarboxylase [Hyphomonas sp.]HAQ78030.1 carboxymuconolactone decarboxylase [Hyphomonas sp.]HCN91983.1 carboxymuconolactone decarboxylase [Hyphomonas sp.]